MAHDGTPELKFGPPAGGDPAEMAKATAAAAHAAEKLAAWEAGPKTRPVMMGGSPAECIVRISEVTDWEAGGRTEARHVDRVFTKEKEEGERRVLALIRRGAKVRAAVVSGGESWCCCCSYRYFKGEHRHGLCMVPDLWPACSRAHCMSIYSLACAGCGVL